MGLWGLLEPVFLAGETFPHGPAIPEAEARTLWVEQSQRGWLLCTALALLLREPRGSLTCPAQASASVAPSKPAPIRWQLSALPPALRRYLLVVGLFTLGNASNVFLLLHARELGVGEAQIPLLWATLSAVAMLGSAPLAGWSDRIGRRRLLVAGYASYGAIYLLIGHLQSGSLWLWPLFAGYGLFLSATEGVEMTLVADLALPDQRGTALGWFTLVTGLALLWRSPWLRRSQSWRRCCWP